jgi:hypothetical protein
MRWLLLLGLVLLLTAETASTADARAMQGSAGPHSPGGANCAGTTLTMAPPQMRAYDATGGHDWQFVAWRPDVWYWNGASWVLAAQGTWLWSWAYDDAPATYWYDFNNQYVGTTAGIGGPQVTERFDVNALGYYYYVSSEFYWYSNASTASAYDHLWVDSYGGDDVYQGFCYF